MDKSSQNQQQTNQFQQKSAAAIQQEKVVRAHQQSQQSVAGTKSQTKISAGQANKQATHQKGKQRYLANDGLGNFGEVQGDRYIQNQEIEFNSHIQSSGSNFEQKSLRQHHINIDSSTPMKKMGATPSSLHLTEQNRKMIKQLKERQYKQQESQKSKHPSSQQLQQQQYSRGNDVAPDVGGGHYPSHQQNPKYSAPLNVEPQQFGGQQQKQQFLHKNYRREQDMRKQVDIELPDSCRYQSQLDCNDQFMISSLDEIRNANDNFTTDESHTFQESVERALEKTPPKKSRRTAVQDNQEAGNYAGSRRTPGDQLEGRQEHINFNQRIQDEQNELFGALDISPIESQDNFAAAQRQSMAKGQLAAKSSIPQKNEAFSDSKAQDPLSEQEEAIRAANSKMRKDFMNSLQDRLRNLGGNPEVQSPAEAFALKAEPGRDPEPQIQDESKKMVESLSQPTYFKETEGPQRKNVILDVLELKLPAETASIDKCKATRQDPASVKKPTQSSSVGPRTDEKCSNSASSNSQKRKQSQPKQGEKVQINSVGLPQHSSSDSSGGSQVESKEADKQGSNGVKLNPVLPYPNAQADALAFLKGEKIPTDSQPLDQQSSSDKEEGKLAGALAAAQSSKQESTLLSTKHTQNESGKMEAEKLDPNQAERVKTDQLHKSQQDIKVEAFQPTTSAEIPAPAVVENEFQSYFQEMNDKANDVMSRQQPEPEKALEFLKQVEDLLKKIQQAQKIVKDKQENDRRKHIRTEVNDTDRRSPRRGSLADGKKDRDLNDMQRMSYEQSLTERAAQDKRGGLVGGDEDLGLQVSGNDFKNLMGMSPANMIGDDLEDESYVYHTIYRTTPCSYTVGTLVVEEPHQTVLGQRSKTSLSAPKARDNVLEDGQPRPQTGTLIPKSQQTEMNQPYKIQYTISQLNQVEVDPTFKVILFYNMACCCQRLHLNDECTQYLESATKALQERIKLLESQEQTLLHQNHHQNLNTVNIIYAPSSRTSVKHGDELLKDDKHSVVPQLLESAEMHNFNLRNQNGQKHKEHASLNTQQQKRGAAQPFPKHPTSNDLVIQSLVAPSTEMINQHQGSINPPDRNLSISQTRLSTSTVHQLQNFKYEKLLAQKMQSLRYQCKLHLQICAVMSQQGMHRDALIFGNKSSHLCYQLIKDAQLLCKRQMQQIRRQRRFMDYDSEEDGEDDQEDADSEQDGVYGEMGAGQPPKKGQKQAAGGRDAEAQKQQIISDEQSINSYSVKSMRTKDKNQRRKRIPKYKRARSNSTQNSAKKHHNETVEQVAKKLEPLGQAQKKQEAVTPSVTQRNSPKKRRAEAAATESSRKSHSSDSKHRTFQKGLDNMQMAEMSPDVAQQKHTLALTQGQPLQQLKDDRFQPETGESSKKNEAQRRPRSRNHQQIQIRSCVSESNRTEQSSASNASQYSSNSLARIKIRRAFDNQSKSSAAESGTTSQRKVRNKFHVRDNSVSSQMSQESLKRIYSFALKNAKSLHQLQKEQQQEIADPKHKSTKKRAGESRRERAKVYYVEEQVKVLSEIIQMADPILTELSSQIFQFEKLTQQKITYKQRDLELYRRYGKEDFMAERDKLNISFHNLKEIKAIQQIKKFKIAVRNTLGLKQLDDWIYNLNIGNVMHLSLMSADELQPIENMTPQAAKHSQINSVAGSTTRYRLQSALELEQASRDGLVSKQDREDLKQQEKNLFETSHDLCKDAMLEKIVLISVAYFCIATEMRFIIQKQKQQKSLQKKDSEMYHAKALHICSLFLPKECPLVQHITQSYNKNYLKDKPEFNLERYLTEELGIDLSEEGGANGGAESASNERPEFRIEERIVEQPKSKRGEAGQKKSIKDMVEDQLGSRQQRQAVPTVKTQLVVPIQLQTSKHSNGSPGKTATNIDESHRLSSENGQDMDEGTSIVINEPAASKPAKGNNRVKESIAVKKASINQIKRSPAISKVSQGPFNTIKNVHGQNMHFNSFSKRGSFQTASQPALSMERMTFNYKPYKMAHDSDGMAHSDAGHHEGAPQKYKKMTVGQMRLPPQTPMALQSPHPAGMASSKTLHQQMGPKHHTGSTGKMNINNRIVPISKVGVSLGQKGGMSQHAKASAFSSQSRQPHPPQSSKHGVQRHYINLTEMEEKNAGGVASSHKSKHSQKKAEASQQRLNTDGQVQQHQIGRSSSRTAMATAQYLRQSQEQLATDGGHASPKQQKKKFEGLLNFFYKKE